MRQARVVPASVMPAPPLLSAWSEVASSDTCVAEVPLLSIRHSVHFDTGRDAGGAAAFDRSVVAEEFSVADEAARAGGSEFDGATCRRAFQFDFGTTGGRDAFEGTRHRLDGDVRGAVGLDRGVGACRLSFQFDHGTSGGRDAFEGARHRLDGDVCRAAGLDRGVIGLQRVFGRDFGGSAGF